MGGWGRLLEAALGRSKRRIPRELELLGAPPNLVEACRKIPDEQQEAMLIQFVEGKHAVMLDWRVSRDEIYEELETILSTEEKAHLPPRESAPQDASSAIALIRAAMPATARAVVHTESFGDFSFLFLVPREIESAFVECVGPWLIDDKAT